MVCAAVLLAVHNKFMLMATRPRAPQKAKNWLYDTVNQTDFGY